MAEAPLAELYGLGVGYPPFSGAVCTVSGGSRAAGLSENAVTIPGGGNPPGAVSGIYKIVDCSQRLKRLRSRIEWIAWGKADPLYGVVSWPGKENAGKTPWTEQEFYATGESEWRDFLSQWSQYGFDRNCCVEIGCGVGRLTGPLTRCFRTVYGIDVSPDVIELARTHAPEATFHVTDGETLPITDGSATAVFSTFVFRHFDRISDAITYFREMHRVLAPGGCMMLEIPVYIWPTQGAFFEIVYRLQKKIGDIRANFLRYCIRKGWRKPIARELQYELSWLYRTLEQMGFTEIEVRVFRLAINQSHHTFLFARRAPAQD